MSMPPGAEYQTSGFSQIRPWEIRFSVKTIDEVFFFLGNQGIKKIKSKNNALDRIPGKFDIADVGVINFFFLLFIFRWILKVFL